MKFTSNICFFPFIFFGGGGYKTEFKSSRISFVDIVFQPAELGEPFYLDHMFFFIFFIFSFFLIF